MSTTKLKPKSHTFVTWSGPLPKCDFCDLAAAVDGKTASGHWGYMCRWHFIQYGVGLGLGRGQELVLPGQTPKLQGALQ